MEKRRLREGEVLATLPHKKPKMDDWDKYQMDHLKVRCADETGERTKLSVQPY